MTCIFALSFVLSSDDCESTDFVKLISINSNPKVRIFKKLQDLLDAKISFVFLIDDMLASFNTNYSNSLISQVPLKLKI